MADTKLPDLTEVTDLAATDWLYAVDVSDTTDHASGSSRKVTVANASKRMRAATEVELDFGSTPVSSKDFTVSDASISATSKVMFWPSGNPATDRVGNDFAFDAIQLTAIPSSGSLAISALALNGHVRGKRKFFYTVNV